MGKNSCCPAVDIDWGVSDESSDSEFDADDLDEEVQSLYFADVVPKLQFRKDISVARWDSKRGMAEVIVKKGRMWTTTGIVREGKIFFHMEEIIFMVERGALLMLDGDMSLSMEDVYSLLMDGMYGCTWEYCQAYSHLKGLGYIVGRHGIPWTLKLNKYKLTSSNGSSEGLSHEFESGMLNSDVSKEDNNCFPSSSITTTNESKRDLVNDGEYCSDLLGTTSLIQTGCNTEEVVSLAGSLEKLSISRGSSNSEYYGKGLKLVFDVYLPNSKFRKSAPGPPDFILCITRDCPPNKDEVQALQSLCGGIPLKFASNECGRISFFSFDSVKLPVLP